MTESIEKQLSMEAIPEESERFCTETHLQSDTSRGSFELLIRAHDRIRALQNQNEELQQKIIECEDMRRINNELFLENQKLREAVREREIKIENLEKLNEKAIIDYVKIERELLMEKKECRIRRNLTALPNELSSPLNQMIRNQREEKPKSKSREVSLKSRDRSPNSKEVFKREERLKFSQNKKKEVDHLEFTFDGGLKKLPSPQRSSSKVLKNCFSVNEISKLVNKVHSRQDSKLSTQKQKLRQFSTFCSSMQKKYSPALPIKKETPHKYPLNAKQCFSPKQYQFRHSTTPFTKDLNSTSSSHSKPTEFNIWKSENYTFN